MPFWNPKQETMPATSEAEPTPAPAPQAAAQREEPSFMATTNQYPTGSNGGINDLLLGEGAEFEGKLTFKGTVRIDARFRGSIETDDVLIVGEHARIDADIVCGTVVVHGQVNGNIRAKTGVELRHTAKVMGDLDTPSLSLEKGAFLQGAVRMTAAEKAAEKPGVVKPAPMPSAATGVPTSGNGPAPSMLS